MMTSTMFFLILLIVLVTFLIIYNKLIRLIEAVKNSYKLIDIQLDRRYKLFESLVEVLIKYMDYEQSVLKEVVALRSSAQRALAEGNHAQRIEAENKISGFLANLNFEQYPNLKANENALHLQEEIASTENKLAAAKQAYNDMLESYNAAKKSLVESWVVALFPSLNQEFVYWGLSEQKIKDLEDYKVKL